MIASCHLGNFYCLLMVEELRKGRQEVFSRKGRNGRTSKHPGAESGRLRWIEGHFDPCILVSLVAIFYLKNLLIPLRPW